MRLFVLPCPFAVRALCNGKVVVYLFGQVDTHETLAEEATERETAVKQS